jgi:probable phosphoglycerate mutase
VSSLTLKATDVVLVRHGETAWSLSGQHTGATDIPLNPAGEAAARALAPTLGSLPFARVFASPLARARRTCELAGFGDWMALDPDLVEWTYGAYEGLTSAEIVPAQACWNAALSSPLAKAPGPT